MTRKEELFAYYKSVKDRAVCVTLFIKMPTGETEVISNSNIEAKMAYIDKTYDDELVHSGCKQICIENYAFACMDDAMDFGSAIMNMKEGHKAARKGWNGKGLFVVYQKGYPDGIPCNKQTAEAWGMKEGELFRCEPYLQINTVDGSHAMWVPSIRDVLAEDWLMVE